MQQGSVKLKSRFYVAVLGGGLLRIKGWPEVDVFGGQMFSFARMYFSLGKK